MDILIIGGTRFVGRALTQTALAHGHSVTLFNRGQSNPGLFPGVEEIHGDRDGGLDVLKGKTWDVAIDTCGYVPRLVKASAQMLKDAVEHYTFISTISVYDESIYSSAGSNEDAPLAVLADETTEEITGETYGGLKVLCEQVADEAMPGRVLHSRCGLIVGPYDTTDRFTYWPVRTAHGGQMLAPPADAALQVIDVRDLAAWIIKMAEARQTGPFNVTGPDYALTYERVLAACQTAAAAEAAQVHHTTEEFLLKNEVQPWGPLPLWLPASHAGMSKIDVSKAIAAGLTYRTIEDTVADTLAWYKAERGLDDPISSAALNAETEADLLAKWQATSTD